MSDKEKNENQIYFIGCFFAVLIVFNFLIVNSFADVCSTSDQICNDGLHPWYVFFMRFQTLITGVLAIVAALITVRQMRSSDELADERHDGLMRLQMRDIIQDRATLKFKFGEELTAKGLQLLSQSEKLGNVKKDDTSYVPIMESSYRLVLHMQTLLLRDEWKTFQRSLTGEERQFLESTLIEISKFVDLVTFAFHDDPYNEPIIHRYFEYEPTKHYKARDLLNTISINVVGLSKKLDKEY